MPQVTSPIAHELLGQYVEQGEALVQRASLVGDFSDYESWQAARKQWIAPTMQALEQVYGGSNEAQKFSSTVTPAERSHRWQHQYATDLDCVKMAIELLVALQGDLVLAERGGAGTVRVAELAARSQEQAEQQAELDEHRPQRERREQPPAIEPEGALEPSTLDPSTLDPSALDPSALEPSLLARESDGQSVPVHEREHVDRPFVGSQLAPTPIVAAELAEHPVNGSSATPAITRDAAPARTRQVFLAHGRSEKWKEAVANLLEHAGRHEVTILNERQNEPRTLVEHLEEQVAGSHYAVVLLTADDVGAPRLESDEEPYFSTRARQGVVFEMGFLVAALTPGCVCVLYEDGVELPCEVKGISYVRLDFAGTWQSKLLLRLRGAGFDYDINKLAPL